MRGPAAGAVEDHPAEPLPSGPLVGEHRRRARDAAGAALRDHEPPPPEAARLRRAQAGEGPGMSASTQPHPDQAFCILAERFAAGSLAGSDREEFRRRLEQQPDLERYVTGILSRDAALREIIPIIAKRREQER